MESSIVVEVLEFPYGVLFGSWKPVLSNSVLEVNRRKARRLKAAGGNFVYS